VDEPVAEESTHTRTEDETPPHPRRLGRRGRALWVFTVVTLLGIAWLIGGATAGPVRETCDPALSPGACAETVTAALKKGMPRLHPLILTAHAEPGPASRPDQLGHRATVTFDLLGVPGPMTVRLYTDMGGHWGGVPDRGAAELALWSAAQAGLVAAGVGISVWWLYRRRRNPGALPP